MRHRKEKWLRMEKTILNVSYNEKRVGVPWKVIRPMVACAFRHIQREAFNDLLFDFVTRQRRNPTTLYLHKSKRDWWGRNIGIRSRVFIGELFEIPKLETYDRFDDMPEYWVKDWREYMVCMVAHEMWHRWQKGTGKEAEIVCENVASDAIDAYRKQEGYTFAPPVTQLEVFQQLVNVHESVFHAQGQPHQGCSVCESLRAPSEECRAWVLKQPVGIALGNVPFTKHFQNHNPVSEPVAA